VPDTFEALAVTLLAILPGALYTWASERETGAWGIKLSDRVLRFVGVSAIFLAFYAVPLRWIWNHYLHIATATSNGKTVFVNQVANGGDLPRGWWLIPILYVVVPFLLGTLVGRIVAQRRTYPRAARILAGANPAPTAWDDFFSRRPGAFLRVRLTKDAGGDWMGGRFGKESYASGYGEEPADLYLEQVLRLTSDGEFQKDSQGRVVRTGFGALLRRDNIDIIEVYVRE
jgi:hypothetical protein